MLPTEYLEEIEAEAARVWRDTLGNPLPRGANPPIHEWSRTANLYHVANEKALRVFVQHLSAAVGFRRNKLGKEECDWIEERARALLSKMLAAPAMHLAEEFPAGVPQRARFLPDRPELQPQTYLPRSVAQQAETLIEIPAMLRLARALHSRHTARRETELLDPVILDHPSDRESYPYPTVARWRGCQTGSLRKLVQRGKLKRTPTNMIVNDALLRRELENRGVKVTIRPAKFSIVRTK